MTAYVCLSVESSGNVNAKVLEVPVGFKWFVDPLFSGEVAFGGEESSGMSFLRKNPIRVRWLGIWVKRLATN